MATIYRHWFPQTSHLRTHTAKGMVDTPTKTIEERDKGAFGITSSDSDSG